VNTQVAAQAERILDLESSLAVLLHSELLRSSFHVPEVAQAVRVLRKKLSRTRPRHKWEKSWVNVPWSDAPGNLYTCLKCGTTRQSVPNGPAHWKVQFEVPGDGADSTMLFGRTPPCPGEA
jgi:hypothetical protein